MAGSRLRRWHVWLAVLPPLALALAGTVYLSLDPSELWPELDWQPPQASSEGRAPFDLGQHGLKRHDRLGLEHALCR